MQMLLNKRKIPPFATNRTGYNQPSRGFYFLGMYGWPGGVVVNEDAGER